MKIKFLTLVATGVAMITAPVAASAAPTNSASSLSLSNPVRTGTVAKGKNNLAEGSSVIPLLIGAGIIAGVAYLVIDHEDKNNNSDSN